MKKRTMLTPYSTEWKIGSDEAFEKFLQGLRQYLKSKLTLVRSDNGIEQYSCGHEYHHPSDRGWKPFKNAERYCQEKDLVWEAAWDIIEEHLGRQIVCECQIVNDVEAMKRARLRRFGFDVDELG